MAAVAVYVIVFVIGVVAGALITQYVFSNKNAWEQYSTVGAIWASFSNSYPSATTLDFGPVSYRVTWDEKAVGAAAYYNKVLKIGGAPVYYISSVTWSLASKGHDPFISGTCYDAKVYNYVSPSYNVLDTKTVKLNFTSSNWNQLSASLRSRLVTVSASITWGPSWVYLEVPVSLEEVVDVITVKFYTGYDPVFGLGCDNWTYSHTSYPSKSFTYIRLG